jgi:hypothetical protein
MGEVAVLIREYKEIEEKLKRHREKARPMIQKLRQLEIMIYGDASWPSKVRAASRAGREHR